MNTKRPPQRGFTLVETLVAVSIAGVLCGIALPSFQRQLHKARRADVHATMMQVQMAQARWRSNNDAYGTLAEIGHAASSANGHYGIAITSATQSGYAVLAIANSTGAQAGDTTCLRMKAMVADGNVTLASGPDDKLDNDAAANRACWGA